MSRDYERALDIQLDLISFWKSSYGERIGNYWSDLFRKSSNQSLSEMFDMPFGPDFGTGQQFAMRVADVLNSAETYWVTPKMTDVFDSQRERLPSYELRASDIPTRRGFVLLGHPIYIIDKHQKRCGIRAFAWSVEPTVVQVGKPERVGTVPLTQEEVDRAFEMDNWPVPTEEQIEDPGEGHHIRTPAFERPDGSIVAKTVMFWVFSDTKDPNDEGWGDKDGAEEVKASAFRWQLFHVDFWMLNQMLPGPRIEGYGETQPFLRVVAAFWTMVNQKITVTARMRQNKHLLKRALDRHFLGVPAEVKVVLLRREYDPERNRIRSEEPGETFYTHSFWVGKETGGFLRNQWYPSEGRHKPIWIEPFIKGDGPLVDKDTVFRVAR